MTSPLSVPIQPMTTMHEWLAAREKGQTTQSLCMPDKVARVVKAFQPQPLSELAVALSETCRWAELKLLSFTQLHAWIMSSKSGARQHRGRGNGFWRQPALSLGCDSKYINLLLPLFSHLHNELNNRSLYSSVETEKLATMQKSF